MALSEDQQQSVDVLKQNIQATGQSIQKMTGLIEGQAALSKLATGGQKPEYDKFSTQDLMDMYDGAVRSSALNNLSDGFDPVTNDPVGPAHPHSVIATAERGVKTADMSREDMIAGIDAVLEHNGYDYDPQKIATAQSMMVNAQAAELAGRVEKSNLAYIKMGEDFEGGYKNDDIAKGLKDLKAQSDAFENLAEQKCSEYVHAGLDQKLNNLAAGGGANAAQMAKAVETAKQGLDPTNMSGGTKHMRKLDQSVLQLDMTEMNLKGADLSQTDLSGVKVDAKTLSEAKGLDKVKGVDPGILEVAKAGQKLGKLQAQLDKLENPSLGDRIKALRHGGVDREKAQLQKEINAVTKARDAAVSGVSVDQQRQELDALKAEQNKVGRQLGKLDQANKSLQAIEREVALSENLKQSGLGGGLSNADRDKLVKAANAAINVREDLKPKEQDLKAADKELKAGIKEGEKALKVRESIGPKPSVASGSGGHKASL